MNQYILFELTSYISIDQDYLLIFDHFPYLLKSFFLFKKIESPEYGGFFFIKGITNYNWNIGLYEASRGNHLNLVNLMINQGANDWEMGLEGGSEEDHLSIINWMISKGANDMNCVLSCACRNRNKEIMHLAISKGATYCSNCDDYVS